MFYQAFMEATAEYGSAIFDASTVGFATFTDVMFLRVFSMVAARLNCSWFRECYTFDAMFYREKNTKFFPESATYIKNISVALEHENVPSNSVEEIHKLQLLNTPLKVLVTYPHDSAQVPNLLEKYAEIIANADIFGDISTAKQQLVIFGFLEGRAFTWRAFVYGGGTFTELPRPNPPAPPLRYPDCRLPFDA
jgi:hypothetical protein